MSFLLKISGEFFDAFDGLTAHGLNLVNDLNNSGKNFYAVIGGGNRVRGKNSKISRNTADKLGVLSTMMNGYILKDALQNSVLYSHFSNLGKFYNPEDAITDYNSGKNVILSSGLGSVGFVSTDLSCVIKSLELKVDLLIKITKHQGIFDKDPALHSDAVFFESISYDEIIEKNLAVMDLPAVFIAKENKLKIQIMNYENFSKFIKNENFLGTVLNF